MKLLFSAIIVVIVSTVSRFLFNQPLTFFEQTLLLWVISIYLNQDKD